MIIETTIRTPQFKGNRIFGFVIQYGIISTVRWKFEPRSLIDDGGTGVDMHPVLFADEDDYLKAKVE